MKVIFYTNVLLSATLWTGSSAQKLLFRLIRTEAVIYSSLDILLEYQNVLKLDFDYSDEEVAEFLEKVFAFVPLIKPQNKLNVVVDDPDDNKIIECAIESDSEFIVTYNKHLLVIGTFRNVKIAKPEELFRLV